MIGLLFDAEVLLLLGYLQANLEHKCLYNYTHISHIASIKSTYVYL